MQAQDTLATIPATGVRRWFATQSRRTQDALIIAVTFVVAFSAGAGLTHALSGSAAPSHPKPAVTTPHTVSAAQYRAVVSADRTALNTDISAVQTDCGTASNSQCYTDLANLSTSIGLFQTGLDANPVPVCLKTMDTNLRAALGWLEKGIQAGMTGIGENNGALASQVGSDFAKATHDIAAYQAADKAAHC